MAQAQRMDTDATVIISISNWTRSKASNDPDGGVASLERWLNHKASRPILASQRQGDVFQIQVAEKDKGSFLRMNGYRWAGTDITVTEGQLTAPPKGPRAQQDRANHHNNNNQNQNQRGGFGNHSVQGQQRNGGLSSRITGGPNNNHNQSNNNHASTRNSQKELFDAPNGPRNGGTFQNNRQNNTHQPQKPFAGQARNPEQQADSQLELALKSILEKRYNAAEKFLDLSALAADKDIQALGLASSSAEKVFRSLFVVLEKYVFQTREQRSDMIESVSFKGNALNSVREIRTAASTFYNIKNLDLSDNNLKKITDLTWWKNNFPRLEQVILNGNPVDSPHTRSELRKWYKRLVTYNMQPLDAPFAGALQPQLETVPPVPTLSPAPGAGPNGQVFDTKNHPEFPEGSTFGLPVPGKSEEQYMKEQLGLKFSYETGLKMVWAEEALVTNGFDYDKAINDLNIAMGNGNVPADAFIQLP